MIYIYIYIHIFLASVTRLRPTETQRSQWRYRNVYIEKSHLENGIKDQGLGVVDVAGGRDTSRTARRHNYATRRQVDEADTDAEAV